MYARLRPWLFRLDAERAHAMTLRLLQAAAAIGAGRAALRRAFADKIPERPVELLGLRFRNPVGLAAGYDKEARCLAGLACLGFGHIEFGTVTVEPQAGNPRPRLFRLPDDQALINRMGFPNPGLARLRERLSRRRAPGVVVGVSIGKGKDTSLDEAQRDYVDLWRGLGPLVDYVAVNVSSPNTLGLRDLQARAYLERLLTALGAARVEGRRRVPLLVKLAPDLEPRELDEALDVIRGTGMDGVIAVNTTVARPALRSPHAGEAGGLSGKPLFEKALSIVEMIVRRTHGQLPVVAVGGIDGPEAAGAMLAAGASLVQVYTGLVYHGPGLVRDIVRDLA
ncbi:MAG TPA: quinone-dependent dihydroorotate dehydrogenase [Anaerolineales bacterium]|nr:quinone-dependent dihydroorotate dehydrogenase [Anaerolineales bacterium]